MVLDKKPETLQRDVILLYLSLIISTGRAPAGNRTATDSKLALGKSSMCSGQNTTKFLILSSYKVLNYTRRGCPVPTKAASQIARKGVGVVGARAWLIQRIYIC